MIIGGLPYANFAATALTPLGGQAAVRVRTPDSAAGVAAAPEPDDLTAAGEAAPTEKDPAKEPERNAGRQSLAERAAGLTPEEQQIVAKLAQRDREVRAHENAHLASAGALARGVSYQYETGPDGKRYAVGGDVSIDTAPVSGDPEATLQKARQVQSAANAPAQPSAQDRAVAAQAAQVAARAQLEIAQQRRAELEQRNRQTQAHSFAGQSGPATGEILSLVA